MSRSTFSGPIRSGTVANNQYKNLGVTLLVQHGALATGALDTTVYLPAGARIVEIAADVTTVFNAVTSATLSIGKTAGGTEYASGMDMKTSAVRVVPTFTAAQLAALQNPTGQNADISSAVTGTVAVTPLFLRVTEVGGASSTGAVSVTITYIQGDDRAGSYNAQ